MVRLAAAVSVTLLLAATAGVQVQRAQRLVAARPLQLPLPGFGAGAGRRYYRHLVGAALPRPLSRSRRVPAG